MASVMESVNQRTQLAGHNRLELLTFYLKGKQRFGINVFKVQEVVHCPPLTRMPQSHPVVRGVATLRGKNMPVIDLGLAIGAESIGDEKDAFLIVTEYNRTVQGFLVGGVERIVNLNWEEILPPPKGSGSDHYLTAVTNIDNELVEIIDVEKVLSQVTRVATEVSAEVTAHIGEGREVFKEQHVLIVDDSSVARNQIRRTLEQLGVNISLANNGREALELLQRWADEENPALAKLAVVVSDLEMPEMDGYTLTTAIRKDPRLEKLYILLHSSLSGMFNQNMVDSVGADQFIPKFNSDELAAEVVGQIQRFIARPS